MSGSAPWRIVGRYSVHEVLARGGMATVHLGRLHGEAGFARTVAIKRLHEQFANDPTFRMLMIDEARIASRIHHPNVVSVLDVVATEGDLYIVMEYVIGESLSRLLAAAHRQKERVPVGVAISIMAGALRGLQAAHEATDEKGEPLRIVHRDVSPHNIMVGRDGIARVVDFGVAKAAGRMQTTRDGAVKGKLSYMSPEQIQGSVTVASDVYAASIVLWEVLAGRRLFDGESDAEVFGKVMGGAIVAPSAHAPGVPKELDRLVQRGLDPDPKKRFSSAREMAALLEEAISPASPSVVGDWVASLAAQGLAERTKLVSAMEATPIAAITSASTPPPAPPPEPAAPPIEQPARESAPKGRRVLALALAVSVPLLAAAFYGGSRIRTNGAKGSVASASSEAIVPVPPASASSGSISLTAPSASAPGVAPPPSATDSGRVLRSQPSRVQDQCNPPWTVDSAGFKHFNRRCFTK